MTQEPFDPIRSLSVAATFYARGSASWLDRCLDCLVEQLIARAASEPAAVDTRN
jgi:hypothetical protein